MSIDFDELNRITQGESGDRHSYFQLQYFLIGKEPTVQSKLWRCVRELKTRKDSMEALKLEIEDANDDLEILNIDNSNGNKPSEEIKKYQERKNNRKKIALLKRIDNLKDRLKSLEEESIFLIKAYKSLEQIEKIKPYDDIQSQKDYWNEKLGQDFNLRILFGMPLDLELIKTILALNSEAPIKIDALNMMNAIHNKIELKTEQDELEKIISNTKVGRTEINILERNKENGI